MEMTWEIKRMKGYFKGCPNWYQIKLNGKPIICFNKKKTAEKFVKIFGKEIEKDEEEWQKAMPF